MSEILSNDPPIEAKGSVCFIVTRANGEIEIRGATAERVWQEQLKYPNHRFEKIEKLHDTLHAARGKAI